MLIAAAFVFGALLGWQRARRRGGDRLDQLQFAAVHAIALTLAAVVLVVVLGRLGVA